MQINKYTSGRVNSLKKRSGTTQLWGVGYERPEGVPSNIEEKQRNGEAGSCVTNIVGKTKGRETGSPVINIEMEQPGGINLPCD